MPEEEKKIDLSTPEKKDPPKREPPQRMKAKGKVKKKPLWKRVKDTFFVETAQSVGSYLWNDVLLPAIKKLLADAGTNAINMAIYGESRPRYYNDGRTHVSNQSTYASQANKTRPYYNMAGRYDHILEGCFLENTDDAYMVRDMIMREIDVYHRLSVLTLSQIVPDELVFDTAYTDSQWGWTSLNPEGILQRVPSGWTLSLPPAKPLPDR